MKRKPKRKGFGALQREADILLSKITRIEAKDRCQLHERARKFPDFPVKNCNEGRCCFHLIPKAQSHALRYHPLNVICACTGGNFWEQNNRNTWMEWLPKLFPERIEFLEANKKVPCHRKTVTLLAMIAEYKNRLQTH